MIKNSFKVWGRKNLLNLFLTLPFLHYLELVQDPNKIIFSNLIEITQWDLLIALQIEGHDSWDQQFWILVQYCYWLLCLIGFILSFLILLIFLRVGLKHFYLFSYCRLVLLVLFVAFVASSWHLHYSFMKLELISFLQNVFLNGWLGPKAIFSDNNKIQSSVLPFSKTNINILIAHIFSDKLLNNPKILQMLTKH